MRSSKSILAGVAAGALALGALSFAGATSASAAPSIKPKATATATASAVRATGTGASALNIPPAKLSWAGTSLMGSGGFVDLTTAPTGAALMTLWDSAGTAVDDTVSLNTGGTAWPGAYAIGDDTGVYFTVDTAGLYAGILANGSDTVSFSFTTAGAPVSMTLTPATQTVLVGGVGAVAVSLRDASGNVTQPQTVDSVSVASNGDDTVSHPSLTGAVGGKLQFGITDDTIATQSAGTSTITATPAGTLPASGVTAQSATLIKSGSVSTTTVKSITVTAPVKQVASGTAPSTSATAIPEGTSSVTVLVDDTTVAAAGNTIRLKAVLTASGSATLNGFTTLTQYVDVVTNASKQAEATFTLGGAALLNSASLVVSQVNVANGPVSPVAQNTITQQTPTVTAATILISPDDSQVAKIGTVTPISVTVANQFKEPQSNWTVQVFRGSTSTGTFLNQGTTNVAGQTSVTVTNVPNIVSGTIEFYSIKAFYGGTTVTDNNTLEIAYTTSGEVSTLSVAVTGGATTPITNSTTSIPVIPAQLVPYGGTASTNGTGTYTVATDTTAGTLGNLTTFTPATSPANNVTVTVPEGVKVSTTATTAWDGGSQTVTAPSNVPVYVFATKTGIHDITFTSAGKTVVTKIKVSTEANAAYNIALTPATQKIARGAFGTATLTLTDVFGNRVPGSATANTVRVTATGEVRLGGLANVQDVVVGTDGTGTLSVIAGNATGAGALTAVPAVTSTPQTAPAYAAGFVKPTNAPDPKLSSVALVDVTDSTSTQSITITGSRTTVSGKPGIKIDGVVTGIEDGKTVIPYFRFPGETTFSQGSARPEIADGSFTWQRKTGKKFYAYVTNDDGAVKSNRVIIAAN